MKINQMVDHTILKPEATTEEVKTYCAEAIKHQFASVVVNSHHLATISPMLADTAINIVTVVGFPLGASLTSVKVFETRESIQLGATEIDMVINIGALKEGNLQFVEDEIHAIVQAAHPYVVKVIIETCLLTDQEIIQACEATINAGAHYVKTSTGFLGEGATVKHISLMKETCQDRIKIKASGGIRSLDQAQVLIQAGANRLGIGDGKVVL